VLTEPPDYPCFSLHCAPHTCDPQAKVAALSAARRRAAEQLEGARAAAFELVPGGRQQAVEPQNLRAYAAALAAHWLRDGIAPLVRAFVHGFGEVAPPSTLQLFTPAELRRLVCGEESVAWDSESLLAFVLDRGSFYGHDVVLSLLVEALVAMGNEDRREFLVFCTAKRSLPPGGLREMAKRKKIKVNVLQTCEAKLEAASLTVQELAERLRRIKYRQDREGVGDVALDASVLAGYEGDGADDEETAAAMVAELAKHQGTLRSPNTRCVSAALPRVCSGTRLASSHPPTPRNLLHAPAR
jgi:hypothetical protein